LKRKKLTRFGENFKKNVKKIKKLGVIAYEKFMKSS